MDMKQFVLTPAAGKRLIGKGMVKHPAIAKVLKKEPSSSLPERPTVMSPKKFLESLVS